MLKQDYTQVREHELKDTQVLVVDLTRKHLDDMRDDEAKKLPISEPVSLYTLLCRNFCGTAYNLCEVGGVCQSQCVRTL